MMSATANGDSGGWKCGKVQIAPQVYLRGDLSARTVTERSRASFGADVRFPDRGVSRRRTPRNIVEVESDAAPFSWNVICNKLHGTEKIVTGSPSCAPVDVFAGVRERHGTLAHRSGDGENASISCADVERAGFAHRVR